MVNSAFHLSLLPLCLIALGVHASLYYDSQTCQKYINFIDDAMASAFTLIDNAVAALGHLPGNNPPPGALWEFPDSEARDLAGRIFGNGALTDGYEEDEHDLQLPLDYRLNLVRAGFQYVQTNFRPTARGNLRDTTDGLHPTDVMVYCDLSRLQAYGSAWRDPDRTHEALVGDDLYQPCTKPTGKLQGFTKMLDTQYQTLYLCHLAEIHKEKYRILPDLGQKWLKHRNGFEGVLHAVEKFGKFETDYYELLDHTLVHELTHCIISVEIPNPYQNPDPNRKARHNRYYSLMRTQDNGVGGGYHWKNVHKLKQDYKCRNNADSYAWFALGAWMLRVKQTKIKNNGYLEQLPNYQPDSAPEFVHAQWTGPSQKRAEHGSHAQEDINKSRASVVDPLRVRQFATSVTGTRFPSSINPGTANSTYSWASRNVSLTSTWSVDDSTSWYLSTSFGTQDTTLSRTETSNSTFTWSLPSPSNTKLNPTSTMSDTVTPIVTESTFSIQSPGTGFVTMSSANTSASTINNLSFSAPESIASTSLLDTATPSISNTSSQSIVSSPNPQSTTSIGSSGVTATVAIPLLPTSFYHQTPTVTPTSISQLCPNFPSCTKPTPSWLEGVFPAHDLYIPKITGFGAVPTQKVKQKQDDDDSLAVIFVKIELPKDKCNPLPKPKTGGLLGIVANVANKLIDTVMDAACNIEFPVLDSEFPGWLDFTKFPGLKGYSPPTGSNPDDPSKSKDPSDPDKSQQPTPSQSQASSSVSSTSSSCSAKTITDCRGTNIISGTATLSFITDCFTKTACSGTGITSIVTSTVEAFTSAAFIVHPKQPQEFLDEQKCYLSVIEDDNAGDGAFAACFGVSVMSSMTLSGSQTNEAKSAGTPSPTIATYTTSASPIPTPTPSRSISDLPSSTPQPPPSPPSSSTPPPPPPPPPPKPVYTYTCSENQGDRNHKQCTCVPDCGKNAAKDCVAQVLVKNENGCNDKCEGCQVPPKS